MNVPEQEHAKNHSDHIPLREDESESMIHDVHWINEASVHSRVKHESRDLKQTDLQCIGGTNFHRKRDIAIHGEGNGIEKLRGVRDKGE